MSCTSSGSVSQQTGVALMPSSAGEKGCCSHCNSQLCSSYLVGLLACLLVVGGIFLAFHRWDYLWLAVSAVGVLLVVVGAILYYCGGERRANNADRTHKRKRPNGHHRNMSEAGNHQNERLLPSALPPTGLTNNHNFSVSQLSLNMLPPFYPSYDTVSIATQVASSPGVSPIMHLNGQSFLLLPLGGTTSESSADANNLAHRLSTHLALLEHQSLSQKRGSEPVNFGTPPILAAYSPFNPQPQTPSETALNKNDLPPASPETEPTVEEEPIYQVPRSLSPDNAPQTDLNAIPSAVPQSIANEVLAAEESSILTSPEETIQTTPEGEINEQSSVSQNNSDDVQAQSMSRVESETDVVDSTACGPGEETSTQPESDTNSGMTTPEPEWALPPSYDEVAPLPFKRLGHLKFAYETL